MYLISPHFDFVIFAAGLARLYDELNVSWVLSFYERFKSLETLSVTIEIVYTKLLYALNCLSWSKTKIMVNFFPRKFNETHRRPFVYTARGPAHKH